MLDRSDPIPHSQLAQVLAEGEFQRKRLERNLAKEAHPGIRPERFIPPQGDRLYDIWIPLKEGQTKVQPIPDFYWNKVENPQRAFPTFRAGQYAQETLNLYSNARSSLTLARIALERKRQGLNPGVGYSVEQLEELIRGNKAAIRHYEDQMKEVGVFPQGHSYPPQLSQHLLDRIEKIGAGSPTPSLPELLLNPGRQN